MNQLILESWLVLQCQKIPGIHAARVKITTQSDQSIEMVATWPKDKTLDCGLDKLLSIALKSQGTMVHGPTKSKNNEAAYLRLALPIDVPNLLQGAIVVEILHESPEDQKAVTQLLQWGAQGLALISKNAADVSYENELYKALQAVLLPKSFQEAAMSLVSFLAQRYACERVSLGIKKSNTVQVVALSDSSIILKRSELGQQLIAVMEEALHDGDFIMWHEDMDDDTRPEHQALAKAYKNQCVMTLVLKDHSIPFCTLTIESPHSSMGCEAKKELLKVSQLLGQVLALKLTQESSLLTTVRYRLVNFYKALTNGRTWVRHICYTLLIIVVSVLLFGKSTYRVGGKAEIQGKVHRAIIAPFEGYVVKANARAGEKVDAGFVIAQLDDTDIKLEQRKLAGDKNELDKQYRKALAASDRIAARILKAQISQSDAKIDLLKQKLERTKLKAAFKGILISGDLSRQLGKPVKKGEVLFEIAPLDSYRVAIEILDKHIQSIKLGQSGNVVLSALSGKKFPIEVTNITHMQSDKIEPGTFMVEAQLIGPLVSLRPGMRGIAKLEIEPRTRLWIWTHEIVEWMRYKLWAWLP